jgi:gamma-glutamylcyclotransferase (GGCT)/AIG2-like uncharacterized protein YtfP
MNRHLFVYGSLMSTAGHPMGERLAREARLLGQASIQGRLYRVSWYPGVVDGAAPHQRVHGEVYELDDPVPALAWLDAYEGLAPQTPNEYERVERPVRLAGGEELTAWVYLYRKDVAGLQAVPDGRWAPEAR